jgi:oxaloacetate decarboxylase alpha subunit
LDLNEIKEILHLLEEKQITEFELEQDGVKLRVVKAASTNHVGPPPAAPAAVAAPPAPAAAASTTPVVVEEAGLTVVKSPIVGTFYRAPDPNAPPFVSVGDRVRVGQVLCIIEAMKLMNEIEAEVAGEVVSVHGDNGQPVQYGDPLFTIRTAA